MSTYTTNDDAVLHYEKHGSGPAVILVHGWGASGGVFARQVGALSSDFTVYAPDLRGHGRSVAVAWGGRVARLSRDLHDLIEAENLDAVRLVGWSMGCSVIWSYLDLFSDGRVEQLVFIDEIPWVLQPLDGIDREEASLDLRPLANLQARFSQAATRPNQVGLFIGGMLHSAQEDERRRVLDDAALAATEFGVQLLLNNNVTDWRDIIDRIRRPTLFVGAGNSFFRVEFHEWMHRRVSGSRLAIRPEAGHFLPIEEADWLNSELLAFLTARSGGAGHRPACLEPTSS